MKKNIAYLFLFLFISSPMYSQNWVQEGETIVGNDSDLLGEDVEISGDGNTMAIGARLNDANGLPQSGAVKIYRRTSDGVWTQLGQTIGGVNEFDQSGASVSLSYDGNTVAIGSPYHDRGNGLVRVFYLNDFNTWSPIGDGINGIFNIEQIGHKDKVALSGSGNRLVISEYNDNMGIASSVKVYEISGNTFNQIGETITGVTQNHTLDISHFGQTIAIASYDETNENGENAGTTRIYQLSGEYWTQIVESIYGESAGDYSGQAISFDKWSGRKIAIGSKYNSGNGFQSGHVRVFQLFYYGEEIGWGLSQLGDDIDGNGENDMFGSTVHLQNNRIITGSQTNGKVKIYNWGVKAGGGTGWIQFGPEISPAGNQHAGIDVSIDEMGNYIIIGEKGYQSGKGAARIFSLSPINYQSCPIGYEDIYWINAGQTKTTDADGVLSNDRNFWSNYSDLSVEIVTAPLFGNLVLNPDGSFTYTHNGNSVTNDAFTYRVFDGVCYSEPTNVTINIIQPRVKNGSWIQDGNDILTQNSASDVSISKDGSVIAAVSVDSTSLKIYNKIGSKWVEDASIPVGNDDGYFITLHLSADGKTVVAANSGSSISSGLNVLGYLKVYRKGFDTENSWTQIGEDILSDSLGDFSLPSVSISNDGNIVAVGASNYNRGQGKAKVYSWNGLAWKKIGQDLFGEYEGMDRFGRWRQLDLSGDGKTLAVGSTDIEGGYVKIFKRNNNEDLWSQVGETIWGDTDGDWAGRVTLNYDGTIVGIGAIFDAGYGSEYNRIYSRGAVKVYKYNGSSWVQRGQEIQGHTDGDIFGGKISISDSGDTLAIGAGWSDTRGRMTGQVKVVRYDYNSLEWKQIGADLYGKATNDMYGYLLQLSADGSRLITTKRSSPYAIKVFKFNEGNVCPEVENDEYEVVYGTSMDITRFENSVIYNDYDANDSLKVTHQSLPSHGTISCQSTSDPRYGEVNTICQNGKFEYTHNGESYNRYDSFTYRVNDGTCDSEIAKVKINITDFPFDADGSWFEETVIKNSNNNSYTKVAVSKSNGFVNRLVVSERGSNQNGEFKPGKVTYFCRNSDRDELREFSGMNQDRDGNYNLDSIKLEKNSTIDPASISISSTGNYLAVGSWSYEPNNNGDYRGIVDVYQVFCNFVYYMRSFEGITSSSRAGTSVAIEETDMGEIILAISSPGGGTTDSRVDVYYKSRYGGDWIEQSIYTSTYSGSVYDKFGSAISIASVDRNIRIAVGAPTGGNNYQGYVRIFEISLDNNFNVTQLGDVYGTGSYSGFGQSGTVSLSGNGTKLAIGSPFVNNNSNYNSGIVQVYKYTDFGWLKNGSDILGKLNYNLGYSVSLNDDGSVLAVGAPGSLLTDQECILDNVQGHAEIYQFIDNSATWKKAGNNITGDLTGKSIGHSVSLSSSGQEVAVASGIYKLIGNTCANIQTDYYGLIRGTTINKNASQGLLSNDFDAEGDILKAYLLNDTKHGFISCQDPSDPNFGKSGSVCLNGSFTYSHDGSSSTVDTLMYKVSDGGCTSESFAILSIDGSLDDNEWTKVGQTLVGEGEEDYFGFVSMNAEGDIMAVGAPENSNLGGISAGHVRVFKNVEDTWTQLGQDIDGKSQDEYMGVSVAISDDGYTLVMGSGYGVNEEKTVRIYKFSNNTWVQIGDDISEPVGEEECFGCKVEISGDGSLIAIADDEEGEIQLYRNNGSTITAIDILYNSVNNGDEFNNMSMSSDGSKIAFINGETANYGEGIVMVYNYSLNGNWSQVGNNIDHLLEGITADYVQISGDGKTVVIGFSSIDNDYCDAYKFVRAYKFVENQNKWIQIGNDVARDKGYSADIDYFGSRIAISGDYGVFTYELKDESWMQIGQTLKGENEDWYEGSISFNKDGSRLALGLAESDYNTNGKVEVYSYPTSALPPPVLTNTVVNFIYTSSTNEEGTEKDIFIQLNNPNKDDETTVDVVLTNGNLEDIDDFASKTLTFPAGTYDSAIQKITINITDDSIEEGEEEIVLSLQNASGSATIGPNSTFTLTIIDNDGLFITGLEEIGVEKNINIYPNPTSGILNIKFNGAWKGDVTLKIFDTFGKEELSNTIQNNSGNSKIELDVSNRKNGIFFIELIQEDKKFVRKIIKK